MVGAGQDRKARARVPAERDPDHHRDGLRVYKELACMKKDQVDLANKVVFIADSKTPTGVAEVPLTDIAVEAFRGPDRSGRPGPWLFPKFAQADRSTRRTSRRPGQRTLAGPASLTSGSMTSGPRTRLG